MTATTARTGANSCSQNALRAMRQSAQDATSRQGVEGERVVPVAGAGNSLKTRDSAGAGSANSSFRNDMQGSAAGATNIVSRKALVVNSLRGFERSADREKAAEKHQKHKPSARAATLIRWCKFNLVGAIGIFVQFAALFVLKSLMHCNYLVATALAVEVAVVHNFVWHERYTWADRVANPSGAKAQNLVARLVAALKRCATQNLCAAQEPRAIQSFFWPSLRRFLKFNLTNGLVSIGGNLGLMRVMVGWGHMNYLLANGIAIAICSLMNFVVSEEWVFAE
jgi:putative flippase GtrA